MGLCSIRLLHIPDMVDKVTNPTLRTKKPAIQKPSTKNRPGADSFIGEQTGKKGELITARNHRPEYHRKTAEAFDVSNNKYLEKVAKEEEKKEKKEKGVGGGLAATIAGGAAVSKTGAGRKGAYATSVFDKKKMVPERGMHRVRDVAKGLSSKAKAVASGTAGKDLKSTASKAANKFVSAVRKKALKV